MPETRECWSVSLSLSLLLPEWHCSGSICNKTPNKTSSSPGFVGKAWGQEHVRCCNYWENCQGSDVKPAESRAVFVYPLPRSVSLTLPFLWSGCMCLSGNPRVCLYCASDTTSALPQETFGSQRNESDHSVGSWSGSAKLDCGFLLIKGEFVSGMRVVVLLAQRLVTEMSLSQLWHGYLCTRKRETQRIERQKNLLLWLASWLFPKESGNCLQRSCLVSQGIRI